MEEDYVHSIVYNDVSILHLLQFILGEHPDRW